MVTVSFRYAAFALRPNFSLSRKVEVFRLRDKISGANHYGWWPDREAMKSRRLIYARVGNCVRRIFRICKIKKTSKSEEILGYSRLQLLYHIEKYPNWHLDHIFPVTAFLDRGITSAKIINSLDNLQPLSKHDNLTKNNTYNKEEFESWLKARKINYATTSYITKQSHYI